MAVLTNEALRAALTTLLSDSGAAGRITPALHRAFVTDLIDTLLARISAVQTLTSGTAVAWAVGSGNIADLVAATNITLTISGGSDGDTALLRFQQDATGSRTLTLSGIELGGRTAPTPATAASARTYLLFHRVGTAWTYLGVIADA